MLRHHISTLILALATSNALADHHHLGADTIDTGTGKKCIIRAGYLSEDADFSIDQGRLLDAGQIFTFRLTEPLLAGDEAGWKANDGIILSSDFYADTGHLDGGDFRFEFRRVIPLDAAPDAVLAWGITDPDGALLSPARTDATSRQGRSYAVGIGSHVHGQVAAFSQPFVYDVEVVLWDANGLYADSDPVLIRFDAGACAPDFNHDGFLDIFDFTDFVTAFESGDPAADYNEDGFTDVYDFTDFVTDFETGC